MMAMTIAKAAAGDPAAIRDVNFLRSIGLIKDEPKVTEEPTLAGIFDMCVAGSKHRKRDYCMQKHR